MRPKALCTAIVGVGSAGAVSHILMAGSHLDDPFFVVVMLVMTALCVPCLVAVATKSSAASVRMVLAMSTGMVLVHAAWLVIPAGGHVHDSVSATPNAHAPLMLVSIALELATATLCAVLLRRQRARYSPG